MENKTRNLFEKTLCNCLIVVTTPIVGHTRALQCDSHNGVPRISLTLIEMYNLAIYLITSIAAFRLNHLFPTKRSSPGTPPDMLEQN